MYVPKSRAPSTSLRATVQTPSTGALAYFLLAVLGSCSPRAHPRLPLRLCAEAHDLRWSRLREHCSTGCPRAPVDMRMHSYCTACVIWQTRSKFQGPLLALMSDCNAAADTWDLRCSCAGPSPPPSMCSEPWTASTDQAAGWPCCRAAPLRSPKPSAMQSLGKVSYRLCCSVRHCASRQHSNNTRQWKFNE
jgi:hypothetical protein